MRSTLLLLALIGAVAAQDCPPEGVEYYPDAEYCDRYTECREGLYSDKQCPDGLLFNDKITDGRDPCGYPIDVDCTGRPKTQPAQPTENCPHLWGYFGSGDRAQCGFFFNCVDGLAHPFECPSGLAFSSQTYQCDWSDQSPDCDAETFTGFSCPVQAHKHARLRSPNDCREFFICESRSPRLLHCEEGQVFNDATSSCDEPELVQECQSYYPPEQLSEIRARKGTQRLVAEELERRLRQQLVPNDKDLRDLLRSGRK